MPISPHLQIYKPQITTIMSITHRVTGIMLSVAFLGLSIFFLSLSHSEHAFQRCMTIFHDIGGDFLKWLLVFALHFHGLNGIRFLFWTKGKGFHMTFVTYSGLFVLGASLLCTGFWALYMNLSCACMTP